MIRHFVAATLSFSLAPTALAQTINIDFGMPTSCPPSTYAAAGVPGVWNCIEAWHTSISNPQFVYQLVDVAGNPTPVTLHQYGGQDLIAADDASISGDDATMMNDAIITHFALLETCLFIGGLENGTYEVITYAWRPNNPQFLSRVRHDQSPALVDVGGAWPGRHVEGVTYARHVLEITSGVLGAHSGNVPGATLSIGAALNGIQLRKLPTSIPGDLNRDGSVDGLDIGILLSQWATAGSADLDGNGVVDGLDIGVLLAHWTG